MKTISRIETFDGETHLTVSDARRHLDELYGTLVTGMANKLCRLDSFKSTLEYLETQTETMRQIVQIADDMPLELETEDQG